MQNLLKNFHDPEGHSLVRLPAQPGPRLDKEYCTVVCVYPRFDAYWAGRFDDRCLYPCVFHCLNSIHHSESIAVFAEYKGKRGVGDTEVEGIWWRGPVSYEHLCLLCVA